MRDFFHDRIDDKPVNALSMRGLTLRGDWAGAFSSKESDMVISKIKDLNANWISIVNRWYVTGTDVVVGFETQSDMDVLHAIRTAHATGLSVMLKIIIKNSGDVGTGYNDAQKAAFIESYTILVNHYANMCQENGIEMFCIGGELWHMTPMEAEWRAIVAGVRERYAGLVTYSGIRSSLTWDGEEKLIKWWDALDYIGISAYYKLTTKNHPTLTELKNAYWPWVSLLENLLNTWSKNILFTEIGFRNLDGANKNPTDNSAGIPDLTEQALCYQATIEQFGYRPWMKGIFWWECTTDVDQGNPLVTDYTPLTRPAGAVLEAFYE